MIKLEFPADRPDIALAFGTALLSIAKANDPKWGNFDDDEKEVVPLDKDKTSADPVSDDGTIVIPLKGPCGGGGITKLDDEKEVVPLDEDKTSADLVSVSVSDDEKTEADIRWSSYPDKNVSATIDTSKVDGKGVAHDSRYCSQSVKPLNTSGKRKDQWKKRRGTDQGTYDDWYVKQLALQDDVLPTEEPPPPPKDIPKDCGTYMGWIAKQQTDGFLTQKDVNNAYEATGLQFADLLPSDTNTDSDITLNIAKLYDFLSTEDESS